MDFKGGKLKNEKAYQTQVMSQSRVFYISSNVSGGDLSISQVSQPYLVESSWKSVSPLTSCSMASILGEVAWTAEKVKQTMSEVIGVQVQALL